VETPKDFDALKKQAPLNWLQIFTLIGAVAMSVWVAGEIYHKFLTHDTILEYNLTPDIGRVDRKMKSMQEQIEKNAKDIETLLKLTHDKDGTKSE